MFWEKTILKKLVFEEIILSFWICVSGGSTAGNEKRLLKNPVLHMRVLVRV